MLGRIVDMTVWDARCWRSGGLWLVVLCLAVYVPGLFNLPPIDRDESRFAQASRQMFEAAALPRGELDLSGAHQGGWAVPMVQGTARLNKPPLIYWLQTASAWVLTGGDPKHDAVWMYRLPSVMAAIFAVLGTWRIGCRLMDPRMAWIGAAMLAVSPMVAWDAHQARADQLLLATVVAAQACLLVVWKRSRATPVRKGAAARGSVAWAVGFWLALAAGIMTKGPITPMVSGLMALGVSIATGRWRWLRALRPELGVPLVVLAIAPWVMAVADFTGGVGKYASLVWDETIGRSTAPKEGHWGPPGYHLLLLPIMLWPGSIMLAPAAWWAVTRGLPRRTRQRLAMPTRTPPRRPDETVDLEVAESNEPRWWQRRAGRDAELFLLCWLVPAWVVFEVMGTKLPHYPMPLFPAAALLCGRALGAAESGKVWWLGRTWALRALNGWVVLGGGLCLALLALSFMAFYETALGSGTAPFGTVFALAAAGMVAWAWVRMRAGSLVGAWRWATGAAVVLLAGLTQVVLPPVTGFSGRLWAELQARGAGTRPVALVGYHEDSLVFLSRGVAKRLAGDGTNLAPVVEWMAAHEDGLVVIPHEWWDRAWAWKSVGAQSETIRTGFNYAKGRKERLVILERDK